MQITEATKKPNHMSKTAKCKIQQMQHQSFGKGSTMVKGKLMWKEIFKKTVIQIFLKGKTKLKSKTITISMHCLTCYDLLCHNYVHTDITDSLGALTFGFYHQIKWFRSSA